MSYQAADFAPSWPKRLLGGAMVLVPLFTSVFPFLGLVNPLWSSLFGLPLRIMIWVQPHSVTGPHPWYEFILVMIWPFALAASLLALANWLVGSSKPLHRLLVVSWIISLFFVIPEQAIGPFVGWPLYAVD